MKALTVFTWWEGRNGKGYWNAVRGGNVVDTGGQGYSRVRDARRAADAARALHKGRTVLVRRPD